MAARSICALLIATHLSGCAAPERIDLDAQPANVVRRGDIVSIVTNDGRPIHMKVDSVTDKSICKQDQCVDFEDIASLERIDRVRLVAGAAVVLMVTVVTIASGAAAIAYPVGQLAGALIRK